MEHGLYTETYTEIRPTIKCIHCTMIAHRKKVAGSPRNFCFVVRNITIVAAVSSLSTNALTAEALIVSRDDDQCYRHGKSGQFPIFGIQRKRSGSPSGSYDWLLHLTWRRERLRKWQGCRRIRQRTNEAARYGKNECYKHRYHYL